MASVGGKCWWQVLVVRGVVWAAPVRDELPALLNNRVEPCEDEEQLGPAGLVRPALLEVLRPPALVRTLHNNHQQHKATS